MSVREIGYISKKRNSGLRKAKKIILMITEGNNQTETNYFKRFESSEYRIMFARGNDTDPVKMIKALISQYDALGLNAEDGDLGMSLIDTDCEKHKDSQIKDADKLCSENVKQYVSSPCFEIWLLCHYEYSTRQYNSTDEVAKRLRNYIKDYSKSDEYIYEKTKIHILIALENAEKLNSHCCSLGMKQHTVEFMPSTEINSVVKILLSH